MVAETGLEPVSTAYEAIKETAPPLRNIAPLLNHDVELRGKVFRFIIYWLWRSGSN